MTEHAPLVAILAGSLLWFAACRPDQTDSQPASRETANPWFEEVALAAGLDVIHQSGHDERFLLPEDMSGGVALFDYDNDGYLDLYFVQGGALIPSASRDNPGNQLYRNRGDGTFQEVTERAGVGDTGYGMGCACADYDADGDVDLYVTNLGPNVLYRNNGDGTFSDVTEQAGVGSSSWGSSALFADYDSDGYLDLFVTNYINWAPDQELDCESRFGQRDYCAPNQYKSPARDNLYHNLAGSGAPGFADVTVAAGIDKAFGNGLGVVSGDFNGDGNLDFYVANDEMPNQLWINTGQSRFIDQALIAGCAVNQHGISEAGMGIAAVDIDHDGDLDLFMSHMRGETNTFYMNRDGWFEDVTSATGLGAPSLSFTGFGLGFADFDHDGILDVYVANGRINRADMDYDAQDPYAEPNQLFRGVAHGRFEEIVPQGGTATPLFATSRAAAFGDIDNDGDIDIVVANRDHRLHLLRNVVGDRGHWIMFRLLDTRGTDAIGAIVEIESAEGKQRRTAQPGYSYCASNDPRVHFGLGAAQAVDRVTVRWPDRSTTTFGPLPAGEIHVLRQGSGRGT